MMLVWSSRVDETDETSMMMGGDVSVFDDMRPTVHQAHQEVTEAASKRYILANKLFRSSGCDALIF